MRKILSSIVAASVFLFVADSALAAPAAKKTATPTAKKTDAPVAKKAAAKATAKPQAAKKTAEKAAKKPQAAKKTAAKATKKPFKIPKLLPPSLTGIASVYHYKKARRGAAGEVLNFKSLIAAHRTFRFGTKVRVTNRKNGKSVVVRIIDRGPFIRGRVIDLSPAAARQIGLGWGLAPVKLAVVGTKA